jgi:multimeric flavodoxin WrbA
MKIVILNGSPKGEYSNTIQYVKFIMKHRPRHEYSIIEVGRDIKRIEKDAGMFDDIIGKIESADGVLWSFPLYHYSVPSQLMRFIEMVSERKSGGAFHDKYATALSTSVHFYDHLAHNYVHAISEDLGMNYVEGFSAEMEDIMNTEWREQMLLFFDHFTAMIGGHAPTGKKYTPVSTETRAYVPDDLRSPLSIGDKNVILVTDARPEDLNMVHMVEVFKKSFEAGVEVVNLNDIDIAGGCLGCIRCGEQNVCVYKDGLRSVYYDKMARADAIVFAGTIRGRCFSSRWKMFWDRSFVNGHCPLVAGGQYGFIVSGPLRQLPDLREEFESRAQVSSNGLAGIVTDEDPEQVTALIRQMAEDLVWGMQTGYHLPPTYLGVGGHLIFRDLIYRLGWLFRADDKYFNDHGLFDYPQKDYRQRIQSSVMKLLMSLKGFRTQVYARAKGETAKAYQKVIDVK